LTRGGLAGPPVTAIADKESKGTEMNVNKHALPWRSAGPVIASRL
jgi:hypothetical protein